MNNPYRNSIAILIVLFFLWGFLTCMNDILIPYLKEVFVLNFFEAMLVQFAFFGAYFIGSLIYFLLSVRMGDPINKIGYKRGIVIGLIIAGIGCLLFYPAAEYKIYGFFLSALFILGLGFTMLQIAANPYVSILGSEESASARLNLAQAFNSFGTTIAPIVGGYLIFEFFFKEDAVGADAVKVPYLIFACTFLVLAVVYSFIKLPVFVNEEKITGAGALKYPNLSFGILAIFTYVGGEVAIGSFLINFMGLPEIAGFSESVAKNYLAYYWGGAMIGRFSGAISLSDMTGTKKYGLMLLLSFGSYLLIYVLSGLDFMHTLPYIAFIVLNFFAFILGRALAGRTLGIFASLNVILLIVAIVTQGQVALWSIISIGLFNSIMWPNIFTLGIAGLGKDTSQGSSLLVMAVLGGALVPPLQGLLADIIGVQASFVVPIACYLYILFYGFKGSDQKAASGGGH